MEELRNDVMETVTEETIHDLVPETDVHFYDDESESSGSGVLKVVGGLALIGGVIAGGLYVRNKRKAKANRIAELEAKLAELEKVVNGESEAEEPVDVEYNEVKEVKIEKEPEEASNKSNKKK